jgi:hypothetical protein
MTNKTTLTLTLCAGAMFVLAGCATSTPATNAAVDATAAASVAETSTFTIRKVKPSDATAGQICKRQAVTGSKFKQTICATKAEWEALADHNEAETRTLLRKTQKFD